MKVRLLLAGSIMIGIGIIAIFLYPEKANDKNALLLSGNVEVTEVNVGFKIPGRILRLHADEGGAVAKNEKLALLESAEYESLVQQSRALVRSAEVQLEKTKRDFNRYETLSADGVVSKQQRDAAKTSYDAAAAQLQAVKASLKTAEARQRDTVAYAPISGVVLSKNVEEGETVAAGTPVFTIGDLEKPWVKVYVNEEKLGRVKLGQRAEVRSDSFSGKIYEGEVSHISSEAEFTPKNIQTREERVKLVYGVKVNVRNENNELKPGMPADVRILLQGEIRSSKWRVRSRE